MLLRALPIVLLSALALGVAAAAASGPPLLPAKAAASSVAGFPCPRNPVSTIDLEACAGHKQLAANRTFNAEASLLWRMLDAPGRAAFVRASSAWLIYRDHACEARSRVYAGGTAAGVVYGDCLVDLTTARVSEVTETVAEYCQGRTRTGPFRRCPA